MMTAAAFLQKKAWLFELREVPAGVAADGECFHFRWVGDCSADAVLRMRNSSHVVKMSSDSQPIAMDAHREFLRNYANLARLDFVLVTGQGDECIGAVNLCWRARGLEIGKYLGDSRYLGRGIAKAAMRSYLDFLRREFPRADLLAKTRRDNHRNIALNEALGFHTQEECEDGFLLMCMRLD
jgi:RimJ/RimL family protein N-acetyltransferase